MMVRPACFLWITLWTAVAAANWAGPWESRRLDAPEGDVRVEYRNPTLSPDGDRVAYVSNSISQNDWELFIQPVAGGDAVKLSTVPGPRITVEEFRFTPNGSRLIYRARLDASGALRCYVVPAAGGTPRELYVEQSGRRYHWLGITPDSRYLLVQTDSETAGEPEIWRFSLAEDAPAVALTNIGTPASLDPFPSRISADSRYLVFSREDTMYSVKIDGSGAPVTLGPGGTNLGAAVIAINGASNHVVYPDDSKGLTLAALDGSTSRTLGLTNHQTVLKVAHYEDDSRIVYMWSNIYPPGVFWGGPTLYDLGFASVDIQSGDVQSLPNLVSQEYRYTAIGGQAFLLTGDEQHLYHATFDGLHRLPLDDSPRTIFFKTGGGGNATMVDGQGSLFLATTSLEYLPAGTDEFIPVPDSDNVEEVRLIENGAALLFRRNDGAVARVAWVGGTPETSILSEPNASAIGLLAHSNGSHAILPAIAGSRTGAFRRLLSLDVASGETSVLAEVAEHELAVDRWAVSRGWNRLAYSNSAALYVAAELEAVPRRIAVEFGTGSYVDFLFSPNENYIAYAAFRSVGPVPIAVPYSSLNVWTEDFDSSHEQLSIYTHFVNPSPWPVSWHGSLSISGDSRTISLVNQEGEEVIIAVDEYGVPVAEGEMAVHAPSIGGDAPVPPGFDEAEVLDVKVSADGSTAAVLARFDGGPAELYAVPLPDGEPAKVNAPLPPAREVLGDFEISPEGNRVIYRADLDTGGVHLWLAEAPALNIGNQWIIR